MSDWWAVLGGLLLLAGGAEFLVRGSVALARRIGVSELLIGLTLVGFGTSTPELVSSVQAALLGAPDVALGNVVGSNIANLLLILGATAIAAPIAVAPRSMQRDSIALVLATLIVIGVSLTGLFSRLAAGVFLLALAAYITTAYFGERVKPAHPETDRHKASARAVRGVGSPLLDALAVGVGLALLIAGGRLLVGAAIGIAREFGLSEAVIGLSIVALGTSLPELVTSLVAALRGKSALALGNVIGSNIYNLLGVLGLTALVHPIAAAERIVRVDNWLMLSATLAMIVFARSKGGISRLEGAILLTGYVAYIGWLAGPLL